MRAVSQLVPNKHGCDELDEASASGAQGGHSKHAHITAVMRCSDAPHGELQREPVLQQKVVAVGVRLDRRPAGHGRARDDGQKGARACEAVDEARSPFLAVCRKEIESSIGATTDAALGDSSWH